MGRCPTGTTGREARVERQAARHADAAERQVARRPDHGARGISCEHRLADVVCPREMQRRSFPVDCYEGPRKDISRGCRYLLRGRVSCLHLASTCFARTIFF